MASTYSDLKFELITTGEQSGSWGDTTNTNIGTAIQEAITGSANVTFSSATVTLTLTDTNNTQTARNLRLNLTGTSGGAQNLIVPAIEKQYIVYNGCADTITIKNSTGTGVAVPTGKTMVVFNDGTNVVDVTTYATSLALGTPLAASSGGTGISSLGSGVATFLGTPSSANLAAAVSDETGSGALVFASSPTLTGVPLAPTAATGTNTTQIATTAFVQASTTALGLGTMSTQNSNNVSITGGTITGNYGLNSAGIYNASGWTVSQSGSKLYFAYNGTNKASLDSSGNFIAIGNVTAYGTP